MDWLGISHLAGAIAGALPYTDERRVAIGRAIMGNPRYLLLDEPAAGMSEHESHDLAAIIKRIAGELGSGVLLIEHNIGLVLELCESIYVLDFGEIIEVGPPDRIRNSDAVRHAYYGYAAGRSHSRTRGCRSDRIMTLLAVDDITVRYGRSTALRGITLKIAEGEILFVTGPNGAGKSTLLNAIAGVVPPVSGAITLDGAEVTGVSPEWIARRGFSLVPEGRNVFGALTIEENLKVGAGMRADRHKIADDLESIYREFPMLAERRHTAAGMLSGGQQQMLVIGRALMTSPRLMAIDEPSLGLAPKIIDQVYEILMRLRAQRKLTLLIVEQSSTRAMMTGGRMILMRGGSIVLEGKAGDMVKDERLKQAYFGFGDH